MTDIATAIRYLADSQNVLLEKIVALDKQIVDSMAQRNELDERRLAWEQDRARELDERNERWRAEEWARQDEAITRSLGRLG